MLRFLVFPPSPFKGEGRGGGDKCMSDKLNAYPPPDAPDDLSCSQVAARLPPPRHDEVMLRIVGQSHASHERGEEKTSCITWRGGAVLCVTAIWLVEQQ